jgi:hypothetical protein
MEIEKLLEYIPFKQCKNNLTSYYSDSCPFCGRKIKRIVIYSSKKKVCKAFCCSVSFKDLSWLKIILTDWDRYKVKLLKDEVLLEEHKKQFFIDKYFEDKKSIKQGDFRKLMDDDLSLPF